MSIPGPTYPRTDLPPGHLRRNAGFTLLELMVALAIFGLLAAMAYGGLDTILKQRQTTDAHAARLAQLQMTVLWLERDIEQTVNRPVRDEYGVSLPALQGLEFGRYQLELTRNGWSNPLGRPRSSLQRVAWGVKDGKLIRAYWTTLDRSQDSQPLESEMLDGVTKLELRFLSPNRQWSRTWPDTALGSAAPRVQPRAVEVTLETEAEGRITRLFRVPGA